MGHSHEAANREARRAADVLDALALHVAERGHNDWERAHAYDGASWDDGQVEWYPLGAYLGDGRFLRDGA